MQTLTFDVSAVNDGPTAADNTRSLNEDGSHTFTEADFGFSDIDAGDSLQSVTITQLPEAGSLTLSGVAVTAGQEISAADIAQLAFTPAANANGESYADLQFTVSDGQASSAEQTLTFDVAAVNDGPELLTNSLNIMEGVTQILGAEHLSATDPDHDDNNLIFTLSDIEYGYLEGAIDNNDGSYSFTQQQLLNSEIRFVHDGGEVAPAYRVSVSDGSLSTEPSASTVTFTHVNDEAVVSSLDTLDYTANGDLRVIGGDVSIIDIDSETLHSARIQISNNYVNDEDVLSFTDQNGISGSWDASTGTLTLSGEASLADYEAALETVVYQNTSNDRSTEQRTLSVTVNDGVDDSAVADSVINVSQFNQIPGILDQDDSARETNEGESLSINTLSFSDADSGSDVVEVTLTITNGVLELASEAGVTITAGADNSSTVTLQGSIADLNAAINGLQYHPAVSFYGTATLTASINDLGNADGADAQTSQIARDIRVNQPPESTSVDLGSTNEDTAIIITEAELLANATDVEGDALSVSSLALSDSDQGILEANGNGTWTYTPAQNFHGDDVVFDLTISDGLGEVSTTATIDVTAVNDAATIGGEDTLGVSEESVDYIQYNQLTINDVDGVSEEAFNAETINSDYGTLIIDETGQWRYTVSSGHTDVQNMHDGDTLIDTIEIESVDGTTHNIEVTIHGDNDRPTVGTIDLGQINEDNSIIITEAELLARATDIEGDDLRVTNLTLSPNGHNDDGSMSARATYMVDGRTMVEPGSEGTLVDNGNGTWTFTPAANFNGNNVNFNFTVSDGTSGDEVTSSATLDVVAVNDGPVAVADTALTEAVIGGASPLGSSVLNNDTDVETYTHQLQVESVNGAVLSEGDPTVIQGRYGDLSIGQDGNWAYTPASSLDVDIHSDLVGHWTFDGHVEDVASGDAVTDTGALQGSANTDGDGVNNNGLSLSQEGDGYLVEDSAELNDAGYAERTVHFSFRIDENNDLSSRQVLFDTGGSTRGLNTYIDDGKLYIGGWDSSIGWDGTWYSIDTPEDNDFHNVSLVLGDNQLLGYLDGEQLTDIAFDTHTGTREISSAHSDSAFGARRGDSAFHDSGADDVEGNDAFETFIGDIDEARIYNRALTVQEVDALNHEFDSGPIQDVFTYSVTDGEATATSTLTIDVNSAPLGLSGSLDATEDATVVGQLSSINFDSDDTLTYSLESSPSGGSVTVNADGSYTFNPGNDFHYLAVDKMEEVTFVYRVTDSQSLSSTATVTVTVMGQNDGPTTDGMDVENAFLVMNESDSYSFSSEDFGLYDLEDDTAYEVIIQSLPDGVLTLDGVDVVAGQAIAAEDISRLQYTNLDEEAETTVQFDFSVSGDAGITEPHTLSINLQGQELSGTDRDELIIGGAGNQTLTGGEGADTFVFRSGDEGTTSNPAVDIITDFNLADGDKLDLSDMLSGESALNIASYIDMSFSGGNTTLSIKDGSDGSTVQTIILSNVDLSSLGANNAERLESLINDGHLTISDSMAIADDTDVRVGRFGGGDIDNGDTVAFHIVDQPSEGSVTNNGDGTYSFSPGSDFRDLPEGVERDVTFTYQVEDNHGAMSGTRTVTLTVTGTNDAAEFGGDDSGWVYEDAGDVLTTSGTLLVNDVDTGQSSFQPQTLNGVYGTLTINELGEWSYEANNSQDAIQYLANGSYLTDTITVSSLDGTTHDIVVDLRSALDPVTIDAITMGDNIVDASEHDAVLVSGTGDPGLSVEVTITDEGNNQVSTTVEVDSTGRWSLLGSELDTSTLSDGEIRVTASQSGNNQQVTVAEQTLTLSGVAPELVEAEITPNTANMRLTFSEPLDISSVPELNDFTVLINDTEVEVLNISYLTPTDMYVTLNQFINNDDSVRFSYTPSDSPVQEQLGINGLGSLTDVDVTVRPDTVAPTRQDMSVDGDQLIIYFNELLDEADIPDISAFTISLLDGSSRTITNVNVTESQVVLTLDSAVEDADIVRLSYDTASADNNSGALIQDAQGNAVSGFSSVQVDNLTDATAPELETAVVDGGTLILTYSEALSANANIDGLSISVGGESRQIDSTEVNGNQIRVQLSPAAVDGEVVAVSYTPGTEDSRIEDLRGLDAVSLDNHSVTNITDTISPSLQSAEVNESTLVLTLDEPLNENAVINPSLFTVTSEGVAQAISRISINGPQVTLTLAEPITDGELVTLDYSPAASSGQLNNNRVEDTAGNDAEGISGLSVNNLTNSEGNPEVVSVFSDNADQWYQAGDEITIQVQFSERVNVTGIPTLELETGIIDRQATYSGGSGTDTLFFTFTVSSPDEAADLNVTSTEALNLNGGAIADLLGNTAELTLPDLTAANSLAQQNDINIDSIAPTVGLSNNNSLSSAGVLVLRGLGFSSLLSPGESADMDLTSRLDWTKLSWRVVDENGTSTDISFSAEDIDSVFAMGDGELHIRIDSSKLSTMNEVPGFGNAGGEDLVRITSDGFFGDAAGNRTTDANTEGVEIFVLPPDGIAPSVAEISSLTEDGEYDVGSVIRLQVSFDEPVDVSGEPVLLLGTGDHVQVARFTSGSGSQDLIFEYIVQEGDESIDLDVFSANALQLNGGTISDFVGNSAVLAVPTAEESGSLASQADLVIDGVAPEVSITGITLAPEGADEQMLTLNGSGFDTLLSHDEIVGQTLQGEDLGRFDWEHVSFGVRQADGSIEQITLSQTDVSSVNVHSDRLEVVLTDAAQRLLDNDGYSTGSGDITLSIETGFIGDRAGNQSATDGLSGELVSVTSDGARVLSITADTEDGSYNAGDEILIRVRFSEVVELDNYDAINDPLLLLLNDRQPDVTNPYGGNAVYESGAGSRELVFRHTLSEGENIDDLNYRGTDSLIFNMEYLGSEPGSGGRLLDGSGNNVDLTLPATDSADSLAANSQIVVDTSAPESSITSVAYDEGNNQLLLKGANFEQLLNSGESMTMDIKDRLDWSKLVIDIDQDGAITGNLTLTLDDVVYTRLAGTDTLTIQFTDAKAAELEAIFGYRGAEDGVDIQAGFLADRAGNAATQANIDDLTLDYADTAAPTVLQVRLEEPGHYQPGDQVAIIVQLSEMVNITGISDSDSNTLPTLTLNNGVTAVYDSGAGSDQLRFVYTVGTDNSENIAALNYATTDALLIPDGVSIFDGAGNNMMTTLPPTSSADALAQTGTGVIDVDAPEIIKIRSLTEDGSYNEGVVIQLEVTMSEVTNVTGVPALNMNTGGQATYTGGSGTDTLLFSYTIGADENVAELDVVADNPLDLEGGSIRDLAGNDLDASSTPTEGDALSLASQSNVEVDTDLSFALTHFFHRTDMFLFDIDTGDWGVGPNGDLSSLYTIDWSKFVIVSTDDFGNTVEYRFQEEDIDYFRQHGSDSLSRRTQLKLTEEGYERFLEWEGLSYFYTPDTSDTDNSTFNEMELRVQPGWFQDAAGNETDYEYNGPLYYNAMHSTSIGETFTQFAEAQTKIKSISAVTADGAYKEGDTILIEVRFSQKVKVDGVPTLSLNGGGEAVFVQQEPGVTDTHTSSRVMFEYTIRAGDDISSLDVISLNLGEGEAIYGGIGPGNRDHMGSDVDLDFANLDGNLADFSALTIDTTSPATTIASISYDPDTGKLLLSGSDFDGILSGNATAEGTELRLILDWSKITYKVNGSMDLSFTQDDVLSARVVDNNRLEIELAAARAEEIITYSGGDYSNDLFSVEPGFIRDLAGNVASTDAVSDASITQADLQAAIMNSALASGNELVLEFSELLNGVPDVSEFTLQLDGTERTITGINVSDQEVRVSFDGEALTGNEQLIFNYNGTSLQDAAGNPVEAIQDQVAGYTYTSESDGEEVTGGIGDDHFILNHNTMITAGAGADTIDFDAVGSDGAPAELIINDFNVQEGDFLELEDVLIDDQNNLDQHFHFERSGSDTIMEVHREAGGDVTQVVTFRDVDLFALGSNDMDIINSLVHNNNLNHGGDI